MFPDMDVLSPPPLLKNLPHNGNLTHVLDQKDAFFLFRALVVLQQYAIQEINTILWAFLVVVTGVLLRRVGQICLLWLRGSLLPGPCTRPFGGYLSNIMKSGGFDNFSEYLGKLHKRYGPVVRLWLGPTQLFVSVTDRDFISDFLTYASDRAPVAGKALQIAFGKGNLFSASGNEAQKRRLFLAKEFSKKGEEGTHNICQKVLKKLKAWSVEKHGLEMDCKLVSQLMAFTVLGTTLFGDCFLSWDAVDEFEKILMLISEEASFWTSYSILPFWNSRFREYKSHCLRLQELTKEIILLSKRQHQERVIQAHTGSMGSESSSNSLYKSDHVGKDASLCKEITSGMVSSNDWSRVFGSSVELSGSVIGMMFHGVFTTAGIISGVLTQLAQHQSIQEKVYAEIDNICGQRIPPGKDDVEKMHYLMATIHESARLLPSAPLLQRFSPQYDLKLGPNFTIPAGTILAVPVQLVQMDTYHWGNDAETFKPERFLSKKGSTKAADVASNNGSEPHLNNCEEEHSTNGMQDDLSFSDPRENPSFLLFGAGSRACIGKNFVTNEILTLLATLLQRFKIRLGPGSGEGLKPKIENCILQLCPSPKLIFEPRIHH